MRNFLLAIPFALGGTAEASTLVFSENFDGASVPSEFSGSGTQVGVGGYEGKAGFSGSFLWNTTASPTLLSLSGLAAHSAITISFDLAIVDSWDGDGEFGPDLFNLFLDGAELLSSLFPPSTLPSGVTSTVDGIADLIANPEWNDAGYRVAITTPHTSSSAVFSFFASGAGFQGGLDESWAIDNVSVTISDGGPAVIPLPASALLLVGGLGGLVAIRRRKSA